MTNIIQFPTDRAAHSVDLEAASRVARNVLMRQGPAETQTQFVTRIVRAYKSEGGQ